MADVLRSSDLSFTFLPAVFPTNNNIVRLLTDSRPDDFSDYGDGGNGTSSRRPTAVHAAGQLVSDAAGQRPQNDLGVRRRKVRRTPLAGQLQLLPVQAGARQPPASRPQACVRRPGRLLLVPGRGAHVPAADAARQDEDGHHQDENGHRQEQNQHRHRYHYVQVQVRPAGEAPRKQPSVRTDLVVAAGRFVWVSRV